MSDTARTPAAFSAPPLELSSMESAQARIRDLERDLADARKRNTYCEVHDGDDAGCAACHAVRVDDLERENARLTAALQLYEDHLLGKPQAEVGPSYLLEWVERIVKGLDRATERKIARTALAPAAGSHVVPEAV